MLSDAWCGVLILPQCHCSCAAAMFCFLASVLLYYMNRYRFVSLPVRRLSCLPCPGPYQCLYRVGEMFVPRPMDGPHLVLPTEEPPDRALPPSYFITT